MKSIFLSILILATSLVYSQTGEKNFIDQNYIEVTGKSEMEIIPDQIYIKVLLSEKDTKNKVSVSELEKQMIQKLKEIGINVDKELMIKDMGSNFKNYLLSKKEIILSKEYQVIVHDGKTASQVFTELEKIGLSNVDIEKLDHSRIEQFRREVKINAIKAAKEKAEALTSAIGQSIGRAIYIQEIENRYTNTMNSNRVMIRGMASVQNASNNQPDIDFEKIHIEYAIVCRFELK